MDSPTGKKILACIRCSEKRVKCDRKVPCAACIKHNSTCAYRGRKPRAKRSRPVTPATSGSPTTQQQQSAAEQPQVSESIEAQTRSTFNLRNKSSRLWAREIEPVLHEPQTTVFKPLLVHDNEGTRLFDNSLWSQIADELQDVGGDTDESLNEPIPISQDFADDSSYVLGAIPDPKPPQHPEPAIIRKLWQKYVDNVDALLKVTHVPTLTIALDKALEDLTRIPKSFEALMFAIYSMAVLSISDGECETMLNSPKAVALAQFVSATKVALVRAKFLSSTSLVVMQAFALHTFSIRQTSDPRAVWNLTGVALRLGQGMGLEIDGSLLGLSPFETEMRRRLWWQLKTHDFRAAELCGQAKFQHFELTETSPKPPANVKDDDLYPTMTKPPVESTKPSENVWNVLRAELASFAASHKMLMKKLKKSEAPEAVSKDDGLQSEEFSAFDDLTAKDELRERMSELVETKYLRFCDPSKPLELLVLIGARSALDQISFVAHHPRRWVHQQNVPASEKQLVWDLCLRLLDRSMMMQTLPQLKKYSWIVPYFLPWPAIIQLLHTLRIEPHHQGADEAWKLVQVLYDNNSGMLFGKDRLIPMAVGSLCIKAHEARMRQDPQIAAQTQPEYLLKLLRLRDRRRAAAARKAERVSLIRAEVSPHDEAPEVPTTIEGRNRVLPDVQMSQDIWFDESPSILLSPDAPSVGMNLDIDQILGTKVGEDQGDGMIMDWDQWDAWLSNAKLMP